MTGGCADCASHHVDDAQWMGELLAELACGEDGGAVVEDGSGVVEDGSGVDGVACTGGNCSKKRMRHINNERQRRILMNNLLDSLQTLLPDPYPRKDRCALLTDVITHVRSLETEIQNLTSHMEEIKRAKPKLAPQTTNITSLDIRAMITMKHFHVQFLRPCLQEQQAVSSPSMEKNTMQELIITFITLPTKGLLTHILMFLQKWQVEVINGTMSTTPTDAQTIYYIHARVTKGNYLQSEDIKSLFSYATFQEDDVTYGLTI